MGLNDAREALEVCKREALLLELHEAELEAQLELLLRGMHCDWPAPEPCARPVVQLRQGDDGEWFDVCAVHAGAGEGERRRRLDRALSWALILCNRCGYSCRTFDELLAHVAEAQAGPLAHVHPEA